LDRPGAQARLLIARTLAVVAAGVLLGAAASGSGRSLPPLKAAGWLGPDADLKADLGYAPSECLAKAKDAETRYRIEVGRAAFRSSLLFGGQAGHAGLSCEACHKNGRTNRDFLFPGLSGAPGTADVTSFLMSPKRGKHGAVPKPIPDLSGPRSGLRISQDPKREDLRNFVHGIVTEEFDGPEPPKGVMDGLVVYVRHLGPEHCPKPERVKLSAGSRLEDARRAVRAADLALVRKDPATAQVMVEAARDSLGVINERYAGPGLSRERASLKASAAELQVLRQAIASGDRSARSRAAAWIAGTAGLQRTLKAAESRSLYNPDRL
jgi:hypothetical protein